MHIYAYSETYELQLTDLLNAYLRLCKKPPFFKVMEKVKVRLFEEKAHSIIDIVGCLPNNCSFSPYFFLAGKADSHFRG